MVVGKPSPVFAVASGESVRGGSGGATFKWKSQGSYQQFHLHWDDYIFFIVKGGPCAAPHLPMIVTSIKLSFQAEKDKGHKNYS